MSRNSSKLIAAAVSLALGQSAQVFAQDATNSGEELETVIVSGIRASLQQSLDVKRNGDSRLEVITAEDVGKLPARNVADALRGLPGVNISSSSADEGGFDESDRVSLRGTSPSLTQTTINGHSVGSADWFVLSQGNNVGRSVSYSLLPAELVNSVEVNKSSHARLQEGGTTGTVNIITRKPFQFDKPFTFEASLGSVYSDQADSYDPQVSGLFNYKGETFGVMLQVFKQERSLRRDAQEIPGGFFTLGAADPAVIANPALLGVQVPGLIGATLFEMVRDRQGGLLELQFKPSDNLTLGLSGFLSDMDANNYNRNFMLWGGSFARAQAPNPGYTVENGVLTSATYAGVAGRDYAVYDMISREATAKSNYITFDADWKFSDSFGLKAQVGTTEGEGSTARQFIAEVTTNRGGGASWTSHGISKPLDWSVGGDSSPTGVTSFGTWGNQQVTALDSEDWITLDFSKDLDSGALKSLDFGARYADHERETRSPEGASPGDIWSDLQNGVTAAYPGDFASSIGGNFPRDLWYFTPGAMREAILANSDWLSDNDGPTGRHNYGGEWKVSETNLAAYVQANFGGSDNDWSGNIGLRYVDIDQEINSYQAVANAANADVSSLFGNWIYQDTNNSHSKLLPSANLKFNMSEDVVFRFAASQTMTMPDFSALGASSWGSDLNRTGGGGNPNLQPVTSTNFDGNLEWYFMPRGLLSVGAFSMDLDNYIAFGTEERQLFSELTNQLETYLVSVPVNSNGTVTGLELVYEQPIGESFGVSANYTYADGKTAHTWADGSNNLVGTSKDTYNVGAYFENAMFSARVSYSYRTEFLIGLSGANPYYQDDFGTLGMTLTYKPSDWLSVSLDALNLNDPELNYYQSATAPTAFYNNGRQFYLNLRAKF